MSTSLRRVIRGVSRGLLGLLAGLCLQVPAQAQNINPSLREALTLVPIPGIKDAAEQLFSALKPIPGANGYTAKTSVGGTPVMLYLYGDASRQAMLLAINGTIGMPGVFNNSAWKRLAGTTLTDPMFSFATLDYTLVDTDMPSELKQIATNSYYSPGQLSFRSGFQMAARASINGVMKTVLETGMGVPTQNFVLRAGVAIPTPTDPSGQASLALTILSDIKNVGTTIKDLPEFYVELQTAPGAVISGPIGMMPTVQLSDATFSMTNAGTVAFTGNLIIPGGKKFITFFQTPLSPTGAMDLVDFNFGLAAQNFTMADVAKLMIALNTPKVPGGNFLKDLSGIQGYLNTALKPLGTIQMRNPRQVGEYRLGDPTKPFPSFDAFNVLLVGPLASIQDGTGQQIQGPMIKSMGDARMFGQNVGSMYFSAGASGLKARASNSLTIKLGPLGKQKVAMENLTEISKDRQVMAMNGNFLGRKIEFRMSPTRLVIDSPATCATPFKIFVDQEFDENTDVASILDGLAGTGVDPEQISGCLGQDLKNALKWIGNNGQQLEGFSAQQANAKIKLIEEQYQLVKAAAREIAENSASEAQKALTDAGNFVKKLFGKKKKKRPNPATTEIFAGSVFDWDFYYDMNPDVVAANTDMVTHWKAFGFNEGRQGSPEFWARWYLQQHPDLLQALGPNDYRGAVTHWLVRGIPEGRQGSPNFSVKAYLARYPDLQQAFGPNNYEAAFDHWMEIGQAEGRNGAP